VAWWGANIRSQGETRKKESRDRGILSVADAEALTGMKHQRVSDPPICPSGAQEAHTLHFTGMTPQTRYIAVLAEASGGGGPSLSFYDRHAMGPISRFVVPRYSAGLPHT
jgi:hypothetical protein